MGSKTQRTRGRLPAEADLVRSVIAFIADDGYRVRVEVPNMGQSADIVATKGRWVTFIEAKTRDWGRALKQSEAHGHVADYICLAIFGVAVSARLRDAASKRGYGVIVCSPDNRECEWAIRPLWNRRVWPPQRRHLSRHLRGIDHVS